MDKDVKKWITRFKRTINAMPDSIELHVSYGIIDVHKVGRMSEHLGSSKDGWAISDGSEIATIITPSSVIPYSEGS